MEKKRTDDHEPGPIPPQRPLDRFGFVKQDVSPNSMDKIRSAYEFERYLSVHHNPKTFMNLQHSNLFDVASITREERRVRKWRKMIGVGGSDWKHYARRKPHVVRRRIRKGIPDCLRGLVWQLISGSRDLLLMNPGVYEVAYLKHQYSE